MGMWIFAEYAWNIFVRADLRAQARGHSPRRVKMVLLVVFASLLRLMDKILHDPRTLNYGNYGIFLIMGNPLIIRVPFFLLFGFNKGTQKKKGKRVLLGHLASILTPPPPTKYRYSRKGEYAHQRLVPQY